MANQVTSAQPNAVVSSISNFLYQGYKGIESTVEKTVNFVADNKASVFFYGVTAGTVALGFDGCQVMDILSEMADGGFLGALAALLQNSKDEASKDNFFSYLHISLGVALLCLNMMWGVQASATYALSMAGFTLANRGVHYLAR